MVGVILCGGLSTRMGTDKALIKTQGNTWLEQSIDLFQQINLPYLVSCNASQEQTYQEFIPLDKLIIDQEIYKGPIRGIMSAFNHTQQDLLVIACDMPFMTTSVLNELISEFKKENTLDAYVYKNKDLYEPLCAIYTQQGLEKIKTNLDSQEKPVFSLQRILQKVRVKELEVKNTLPFQNINEQQDIID